MINKDPTTIPPSFPNTPPPTQSPPPLKKTPGQLPAFLPLFPPSTLHAVFAPLCFALLEDPVAAVREQAFVVRTHACARADSHL